MWNFFLDPNLAIGYNFVIVIVWTKEKIKILWVKLLYELVCPLLCFCDITHIARLFLYFPNPHSVIYMELDPASNIESNSEHQYIYIYDDDVLFQYMDFFYIIE